MCAAEGAPRRVPGPAGTRFAQVCWFGEIDSTNRWLADEARDGAPEGTVAAAEFQRAGRGRLGRRWEAPAGSNLLVSVLLRPRYDAVTVHRCAAALALAAADACAVVAGVHPGLKWPNDLVVGERKLAGLLAEVGPGPDPALAEGRPCALVLGLGLNLRWPPPPGAEGPPGDAPPAPAGGDEGADDVMDRATSLAREAGPGAAVPAPADVLAVLLGLVETRLAGLEGGGGAALEAEVRRRCVTLGRPVRVVGAARTLEGRALDITPGGELVLEVDGVAVTVAAGDVVHLRHAG
ncbi:MAG TPA: biotin--[acetyl-CoA-carboxylase] ligase [Acidimicrobiales bacterium]|nr:biotin--[acetyl-CoA-carboxylase] ligase [Acidimicrobiales bacterium]